MYVYVLCDTLLIVENFSELLHFILRNRKVKTDDVSASLHREFLLILTTTLMISCKGSHSKMRGNQAGLGFKAQFSMHWDRWVDVPVFQMLWTATGAAGPPGARGDATYRRSRTRMWQPCPSARRKTLWGGEASRGTLHVLHNAERVRMERRSRGEWAAPTPLLETCSIYFLLLSEEILRILPI